jgi:phenylpropionate dioxygenase-like ring-hydroxylating dioxygenase large terminal subunit
MRLTMGTNTGTELKCRYHGWRFAGETGMCTFIPAHPEQTPPRAAVVRSYRSAERYGLIWIARGDVVSEPGVPDLHGPPVVTLRSVTMHVPQRDVAAALAAEPADASTFYLLQPQSATVTTVHGIVAADVDAGERLALLRGHNERLTKLRRNLEGGAVIA